jgi:hypothetical protein
MDATSARSTGVTVAPVATVRVAIMFAFVVVAAFADCGRRQKGEALPAQHRCPIPAA